MIILEFYFDFGSPTAYLAYQRLLQLQQQYDLDIDYKPMLLGGVFKATGNHSPAAIPAKGLYMMTQDLPRFAKRYNVAFRMNSHFPINTLTLMRGAHAALDQGCFPAYCKAVFEAMWIHNVNLADPDALRSALDNAELNSEAILNATQDAAVKARLVSITEEAVTRGVFGAPTLFVGEQMFFGQDRLDFVEELLTEAKQER